jgi:hypothetical protein
MLISLTINWITDQLRNEQMSMPRFEPGSFMTERERSTNRAINQCLKLTNTKFLLLNNEFFTKLCNSASQLPSLTPHINLIKKTVVLAQSCNLITTGIVSDSFHQAKCFPRQMNLKFILQKS